MRLHKVEIKCESASATVFVRDAGGDEFKEVAAIRQQMFRLTGEFPTATWKSAR